MNIIEMNFLLVKFINLIILLKNVELFKLISEESS